MEKLIHRSKLFLKRNSSTILTVTGAVGVVATSVMAVKATPKAMRLLNEAKEEKGEELTRFEAAQVAGPAYIPAILTGVGTIACIFGANTLNKRQQAALMSAYALLDNSYKEYKAKVEELYGEEGRDRILDEIAKDKYNESSIKPSSDKQLFYDEYSRRYFESTIEEVQKAEYDLNRDIQTQGYATLSEFYERLGIEDYDDGGMLGWSERENFARYWQSWVDFSHTKAELDDGLECIILTMWSEPYIELDDF